MNVHMVQVEPQEEVEGGEKVGNGPQVRIAIRSAHKDLISQNSPR